MTQSVLVTGFSGFVGSKICSLLHASGAQVLGMGRKNVDPSRDEANGPQNSWIGDITMDALLAHAGSPDVIVHCASGSSVAASIANPRDDFANSVLCINDILAFMRLRCPHARLVFASSAAIYGSGQSGLIQEVLPARPISPYGLHKQICEDILRFHAHACGLKVAIVRLFSIYGEGLRKQLLWDACGKISTGNPIFSGSGNEVRDWLHVSDAARLMLAAVDHASEQAPICNGATGKGTAVRDVISALASDMGLGGLPQFNGLSRPGDPESLVGSVERAHAWGWEPQIDWREGVRQYADWYRSADR